MTTESTARDRIVEAAILFRALRDDDSIQRLVQAVDALLSLPSRTFELTGHVVHQYKQRTGCGNSEKARRRIREMIDEAQEVEVKERFKVIQLLNHQCRDARYFIYRGMWMLVVVEGYVVTVYQNKAKRWK